jgi:hypothetical protein
MLAVACSINGVVERCGFIGLASRVDPFEDKSEGGFYRPFGFFVFNSGLSGSAPENNISKSYSA